MSARGQHIIQIFEQLAPKYLAIPEDKIGLQLGTLNKDVNKVLLTLDVLDGVVDEAIDKDIDLIISHHPIIYRPLKVIRTDIPQGQMYEKLIKNDIAVYVAHTNLDIAMGGVNDTLVEKIGLENAEVFFSEMEGEKFGLGRIGVLPEEKSLDQFAKDIKKCLNLEGVRVVGVMDRIIKKVAVVGGDGNKYISLASFIGADVLITGDIYYHNAHDAMNHNLALIDVGHYVEKNVFENVKLYLEKEFDKNRLKVDIIISEVNTNPFKFL